MENIIKLNRKRDTYVDVAKGIGIMLIVSIHTEVFGVMGYPLSFYCCTSILLYERFL